MSLADMGVNARAQEAAQSRNIRDFRIVEIKEVE